MGNKMNCLICKKELYSEIGTGCKMCGMFLEYQEDGFCCEDCEEKYDKINYIN